MILLTQVQITYLKALENHSCQKLHGQRLEWMPATKKLPNLAPTRSCFTSLRLKWSRQWRKKLAIIPMRFLSWPRRSWNASTIGLLRQFLLKALSKVIGSWPLVSWKLTLENFILVELWMFDHWTIFKFRLWFSGSCFIGPGLMVSVEMLLLLWRSLEFWECRILRLTMQPSMRRQFSRCDCWCGPHVLWGFCGSP